MEALARWNDPVKGFLMPCDFITALEDSREIYKLDLEIIRQVAGILHFAREAERLLFLFRSIFRASIFFAAIFLRK